MSFWSDHDLAVVAVVVAVVALVVAVVAAAVVVACEFRNVY